MKKALTFLVLLVGTIAASGQQDFDYKLYTQHAQTPAFMENDSTMTILSTPKIIRKDGNRLVVASAFDPTNVHEFEVRFEGLITQSYPGVIFTEGCERQWCMYYITTDRQYSIAVWPVIPIVVITDTKTRTLAKKFF